MAITLTISQINKTVVGSERLHSTKVVTAGTYETGGFAFTPANVGLFGFTLNHPPTFTVAGGYSFEFVPATNKVKVYNVGAVTPTGTVTVAVPTFTVATGVPGSTDFHLALDTTAATGRIVATTGLTISTTNSPVGAQAATFAGTAQAAGAAAEVANGVSLALTTYVDAYGF